MKEENKLKKNSKHDKEKELEGELEKLQEEVLRGKAEIINYRKRKDEEISNMLKYCNEDVFLELLPVMDNFERAINLDNNNLDDNLSRFLSGFKLIYSHMRSILEKNGVKEIDCLGKTFDANYETSVFTDNDPNYADEEVLEVLQKGYTYNDKLLRSASVKINKIENKNKEGNDNNE